MGGDDEINEQRLVNKNNIMLFYLIYLFDVKEFYFESMLKKVGF